MDQPSGQSGVVAYGVLSSIALLNQKTPELHYDLYLEENNFFYIYSLQELIFSAMIESNIAANTDGGWYV